MNAVNMKCGLNLNQKTFVLAGLLGPSNLSVIKLHCKKIFFKVVNKTDFEYVLQELHI